jgi:tripartite-type tricarboxylate transporter receptor subunit TctC
MTKLFSLLLTFLATSIGSALAQSYPTRTVNIILAFPPGGPNEGVVRFLAEKLTASLGQAVIIENRPGGAGGTVGTRSVANAAPDGHTLLLSPPGPLVIAPNVLLVLQDAVTFSTERRSLTSPYRSGWRACL